VRTATGLKEARLGTDSTEAVTGAQLYATNDKLAGVDGRVTQNSQDIAKNASDIADNKAVNVGGRSVRGGLSHQLPESGLGDGGRLRRPQAWRSSSGPTADRLLSSEVDAEVCRWTRRLRSRIGFTFEENGA
jgi:hypothetical protein